MNKEQIRQYLLAHDERLLPLISMLNYPITRKSNKDVYTALLQSIISQQLSVKAADTIHKRLLNLFPNDHALPELLLKMSVTRLRSAGLSKQKVAC